MGENTKIEWADHSWNPWIGCTKVSPGCKHCYAAESTPVRVARGRGREMWGKGAPRQRTSAANWRLPLKWNFAAACCPTCGLENECVCERPRPRVFPSLCDWLDDEVPIEWLAEFLSLVHSTPNLDWLLLTKRPENFLTRIYKANCYFTAHIFCRDEEGRKLVRNNPNYDGVRDFALSKTDDENRKFVEANVGVTNMVSAWVCNIWSDEIPEPPTNVWIGVSVENQEMADNRIPLLLNIPAKVLFLSVEPLLGPISFSHLTPINPNAPCSTNALTGVTSWPDYDSDQGPAIDWVIVGGESGNDARGCNVDWIRKIVTDCKAAQVPVFVKQLGAEPAFDAPQRIEDWNQDQIFTGSWISAIEHHKGGDPNEWPDDLRVRQFPEVKR